MKQSFTPRNFTKLCYTPQKFQGLKKPRPPEIPHNFFLTTRGNSTLFVINPWKIHQPFLQYLPGRIFHLSSSTHLFFFFWNSPIIMRQLPIQLAICYIFKVTMTQLIKQEKYVIQQECNESLFLILHIIGRKIHNINICN